jgi:hypothetical protein
VYHFLLTLSDVAGIEQGGYKLVYLDHAPTPERGGGGDGASAGARAMGPNVWYSIGLRVGGPEARGAGAPAATGSEGTIVDVRWGGPADDAKLAPGQKILAVNGHTYSSDVLLQAVRDAKLGTEPIHLILEREGSVTMAEINYHDGEKYPALERVGGTPDYLSEIAKPLTTPPAPATPPPAAKAP